MRNSTQLGQSGSLSKSVFGKLGTACAVAALALLGATSAQAVPVTYTYQYDNIVAQMDGVDISGPLTITAVGDSDFRQTTDYPGGNGYLYTETVQPTSSFTFNFANFGTFSLTSPMYVYSAIDTYGSSYLGFRTDSYSSHATNEFDSQPALYDLSSGISAGPMAGGDLIAFVFDEMTTTGGHFVTDPNQRGVPLVFTASVDTTAVPEPASLSLFAGAGIALLLARRRKQANQAN